MKWPLLVLLLCIQSACAVREVHCAGPLRTINAATTAHTPPSIQQRRQLP
jgi:hypothetical protein